MRSQLHRRAESRPDQHTHKRASRRGATISAVVGALALLVALAIGAFTLPSHPKISGPGPATNHELAVVLTRLRLDAEPLAAAGLSAQQTTALVGNMRSHLVAAAMDAIRMTEVELGDLSNAVDSLTRRIQAGQGNQEDIAQLATATSARDAARAALHTLLGSAFSAAVEGLGEGTVSAISTHRGNVGAAANEGVPTQYMFTGRSEAQWVALRDALSNIRVSARHETDPNPDAVALVTAADSEQATAAAATNLAANLTAVRAAWSSAVYPQ